MIKQLLCDVGMTLIELLLVIAIAGTLLLMAAPDFRGTIEGYRLSNAARDLTGNIRLVRERAVDGESSNVQLLFDTASMAKYYLARNVTVEREFVLPQGVVFASVPALDRGKLYFYFDGSPHFNSVGNFRLRNSMGKIITVELRAVTGRVRILSP